jgi:putative transcriptional regulator
MNKKTFEELHASVRDGGAILRGKMKPARRTVITGPEIATIRKNMELSQAAFARMMGISVDTLQNWEQERRVPDGPARALLTVAAKIPEAVKAALQDLSTQSKTTKAKPRRNGVHA